MSNFYLIFSRKLGLDKAAYEKLDIARLAAEDAARTHPGVEFHILSPVESCKVPLGKTEWKQNERHPDTKDSDRIEQTAQGVRPSSPHGTGK